jgi:ABC-2 type transport system permease protein
MRTTSSSVAVFFWTLRRRWKGFAIFVCATVAVNSLIISVYPEFSGLRDEAIAEALGGDIEVSLTQPNADDGSYVIAWGKHDEADGYVLIESDADIPLTLITSAGLSEVDLQLLVTFLPSAGKTSAHMFDASTTEANLTGLDKKYPDKDKPVFFGVLAFRGEPSNATIIGASQTVNTADMVFKGAYDKLLKHPLMKAFLGGSIVDFYSIKGFLCVEMLAGLTLYIIVYFLIQYASAFSWEIENKTIDIVLSTPLTRRSFFVSRYLSWAAMNVIMVLSWIVSIYIGILAIGEGANVTLGDVARVMISFLPFLFTVQGICMLASVVANESRKAYAVAFGVYFGMYVLKIVATIGERLSFLKYFTIFHYWQYGDIFIASTVAWGNILLLMALSAILFVAALVVFERKDLPS